MLPQVTLFSDSDIDTMFSIFDLTGRGTVTRDQLIKGIIFSTTKILCIYLVNQYHSFDYLLLPKLWLQLALYPKKSMQAFL